MLRIACLLAFAGVSSCSLAWDFDELTDGECGEGEKACNDQCVPNNIAGFGCARESCAACSLENAIAICNSDGECVVSVCSDRYQDCDGDEISCEVNVGFDPLNCGECDFVCPAPPNGLPGCSTGFCTLGGCLPGFGSCDGDNENGCETDVTTSPLHCGECDAPCDGAETCIGGRCE